MSARALVWRRGLDLTGHALLLRARRLDFGFPTEAPGHPVDTVAAVKGWPVREPEEIEDEAYERVLERVCAIDVGKASGKVCTRVPHPSRPGQRRTRVWDVEATTNAIVELGEYLAGEGSRRSPWSRRRITGGSGSTCWKRPVWTCSWSTPARSRTRRAGRRPTSWTVSGRRR